MFIQIQNERFKISTIQSFKTGENTYRPNTYVLYLRRGGKNNDRSFTYESKKEFDKIVDYLDQVLKVQKI